MRLVDQIRAKRPELAERAKRSPIAATRLFCLECMGGSAREVDTCCDTRCPLHPFRLGKTPRSQAQIESGIANLARPGTKGPPGGSGDSGAT